MKHDVKFKDILDDYMQRNNLNQTQIAKMIGVKPSQVSEWLSGKSNPGYTKLKSIYINLNITADELFGIK